MPALIATTASLPAGGGPYRLESLSIGVFLTDQPSHRLTIGSDRARHLPLSRHQGWVLPAGAEGHCAFDAALDLATVSLPTRLLRDAGLEADPSAVAPIIGELDPLLLQMVIQADGFAAGGTLYAETMAQALAAQMARLLRPAEPAAAAIDDRRLRRAVEHIRAHLAEDLSLEGMAAVATMSPSHFARAFKQATGQSPLKFVIGARLETAMALLRTTRLTVAEIAYRVGYNDVPRFTQHFRRRFGMTPGAARQG
ncbi:MAG: AraC family transcriptional regulator [Pseudomonadota bacterium]